MKIEDVSLEAALSHLTPRHRASLQWFAGRRGTEIPWPEPLDLPDGRTFLATQAKGIYKPEWSPYALSVRQTLGGPYADREPIIRPDGTWVYEYYQENPDPSARDREFTNLGLVACMNDCVPVAVMRQTKPKPGVRYHILGLALVSHWDAGYFLFEGFGSNDEAHQKGALSELDVVASSVQDDEAEIPAIDARKRVLAQIVRRQGQGKFREMLLAAYASRCCISGCDLVEALEAAHISPYNGQVSNHPTNGLLLRADLHTLFDLRLITVSDDLRVIIAPQLIGTTYESLGGTLLRTPEDLALRPSAKLLAEHRHVSRLSPPLRKRVSELPSV